jgi:Domain of unknown function (DUF4124)
MKNSEQATLKASVRFGIKTTVVAALWLASAAAWAQIYTCVDANGKKITSDRPIPECAEREQKELNSSGTVKRTVKPVMTVEEQRVFDDKQRAEAEERSRIAEEKRKDRALLTRYPNRASHDQERIEALAQVDDVMRAATKRIGELGTQRKEVDAQLEFYKKDPSKAPPSLRRQVDDNNNSIAVQKRFVIDQEGEKKRINARFDEELGKLKTLWQLTAAVPTKAAASAKK